MRARAFLSVGAIVLAFVVPVVGQEEKKLAKLDLTPYLPKADVVAGGLYRVGANPEAQAASEKMGAALKGQQEWIKEYMERHPLQQGEYLPYHPNFGITKEEYLKIVDAIGKLELIKMGDVKIRFARNASGVGIAFEGKDLPLKGVRVFYKQDVVQTQRLKLKERVPIDQDDANAPTGRWEGMQWRHLQGKTLDTRFSEKFAIGKMKDKKQGIIYYDLRAADKHGASMILLYDLK